MNARRTLTLGGLIATALALGLTVTATAQPEDRPPPKGPPPQRGEGLRDRPRPIDRQDLKQRLERRREATKRLLERLEAANARLEQGADPTEIQRELERLMQAWNPGGPRPGGPLGGGPDRETPAPGQGRGPKGPDGPGLQQGRPERPMADMAGDLGLGPARPLAPEERAQIREFLKDQEPEIGKLVDEIAGANPALGDRAIDGLGARMHELRELRERDPAMFDLRRAEVRGALEMMRSARQYAEAASVNDPARVTAAEKDLRERMAAQFEARAKIQQKQISDLERRLDRMRKDLDGVQTRRDAIIDERLDALKRGATRFIKEAGRRKGGETPPSPPPP